MNRAASRFLFALLPWLISMPRAAEAQARCDSTRALRTLFIGNSFTYVQNVPRLVEGIAASLPGPCIRTAMIAEGGATLEDHWVADSAVRRIRDGGWTHVVLNDQSTFGEMWIVEGRPRIGSTGAELLKFTGQFAEAIRASGAKPVLLSHWSDDGASDRDQAALDLAFANAARVSGSTLSPAGRAIKRMRVDVPEMTPYFDDNHHLSAAGAYLEALVIYGTLTGHTPVGAASRLTGAAVELNRGIVFADSVVALVDLPAGIALRIQKIAEQTLADFRSRGPVTPEVPPLSAEYPHLTPGKGTLGRDSLQGHWSGSSSVLPTPSRQPVLVELFLSADAAGPDSAVLRLPAEKVRIRGPSRFAGRAEVRFEGGIVVIRAPVAPNDGIVELRGVLNSGVLSGLAEVHILGPGMRAFHSIGRFELRRE